MRTGGAVGVATAVTAELLTAWIRKRGVDEGGGGRYGSGCGSSGWLG
jgi:hypothetical protein